MDADFVEKVSVTNDSTNAILQPSGQNNSKILQYPEESYVSLSHL